MLYLFSGDDVKNKTIGYEKFIKSVPAGAETFFISKNNFDQTQIESLYSGASLFSALCMVVFQNVFDHEEMGSFILGKLKSMNQSNNSFIFLEGKLNKPILDAFKKNNAEINIFELPKSGKEKFNTFIIANAFADKDKKNIWIHFRQAIEREVSLEEIVGVLFWKVKDMLLKKNFGKYSPEQLKNYAARLSYLLPEARKEGRDAESALEQFLLGVF